MRYVAAIGLLALFGLSGCDYGEEVHPGPPPTVAKICRDGTAIWHYADGTYRIGWGAIVEDVNTVCQP